MSGLMEKISTCLVSDEHLDHWVKLWNEHWKDNYFLLRTHDAAYYKHKYLNNKYAKAFCCIDNSGRPFGFCGVRINEIVNGGSLYKFAEFSDFIFETEHRGRGYVKEFINSLLQTELKDCYKFIFYPIDRSAFISWRFIIKSEITHEICRWCLLLDYDIEIARKAEFKITDPITIGKLKFKRESGYLLWRYTNHQEQHELILIEEEGSLTGYFVYKTVTIKGSKGAEIAEIYSEVAKEEGNLRDILSFLRDQGAIFLIFKTLKHSVYDQFFAGWEESEKTFETKYAMVVNNPKLELGVELQFLALAGEELDIPREGSFVTKILEKVFLYDKRVVKNNVE